jgi:hypothetical protein
MQRRIGKLGLEAGLSRFRSVWVTRRVFISDRGCCASINLLSGAGSLEVKSRAGRNSGR